MKTNILSFLFLALPLVIGGVFHALTVRFRLFEILKIPISKKMFGENKTIRGFVVFPVFTVFGLFLSRFLIDWIQFSHFPYYSSVNLLILGLVLGGAYMFFELPNSYIKRRLGIPPGKRPKQGKIFFTLLDQTDSVLGSFLVLWLFVGVPLLLLVGALLFGILLHLLVNLLLYCVGVRDEAF